MTFGLSSSAFRSRRLGEKEIAEIAEAGFSVVDLVTLSGHCDFSDVAQLDGIVRSAAVAGVSIASLSVPLEQLPAAVPVAVSRGWPMVIVRLGPCRVTGQPAGAGNLLAAMLEKVADVLPERGCTIAVQAPGGRHLTAETVAEVIESLDDSRFGVCFDAGHAQLDGGAAESVESLSGLVISSLLHDNTGREDLHRAPGEGSVNWPAVMTACWKTGFVGPWLFDVAEEAGRPDPLTRAVGARARLQAILEDLAQPMTFTE